MKEVDARGLQCPKPLMMAKKELDGGCDSLLVKVSNEAAVSNLQHLAGRMSRKMISGMFGSAVLMGKRPTLRLLLANAPSWSLMPYLLVRIMWAMVTKPWARA